MIVSASRRTDIPAFYSQWFMNRVRAGWCLVPNPMNARQVTRVPLTSSAVDGIVFWSKDPSPLLPYIDELERKGLRFYFQFCLNDYPTAFEPYVPPVDARVETFLGLARRVGAERLVWRYDPIIISNATPYEYHRERFSWIAQELKGATRRVMVSIVDFYRKTERRLSQLESEGYQFCRDPISAGGIAHLLGDVAAAAKRSGMEAFTCAEECDFTAAGVPPGRCIDERILNSIGGLGLRYQKDPGQRQSCLCMLAKDIGMNDTCGHGCVYCYATQNPVAARRRLAEHDPDSPAIWGHPEEPSPKPTAPGQRRLFP